MPEQKCLICQSETKDLSIASRKFLHCQACLFTSLDPQHFLNIEDEKARYELHENTIDNEGYVKMFEEFIAYAISPFQVNKVLDYGSGPEPVLTELLKRKGYQAESYDPFYAQNSFTANSFEMIVSTEVFEHFFDPLKEIEKVLSLLKTGGYLSIMTRFNPGPREFENWFYKNDPTHVSFYALETFEFLAQKYKLEILKQDSHKNIVFQKLL